ncbi:SMC family ATPase [Actinomadura darangshiensis]|uniref:Nuclease SbcCD subunit C n=1 Tax=Actinomadura darangshiensis TaxID=705336 RepID=A0A4R5ANW8_9ACTN|nr:SMC family ATPase [Actinomadura darangshiensis]TDD73339.1 SMC family ATPase [Actinomadura darangshiensis]
MRPLCVHMENFCSYRAPASADLHDVDYFVLVGPTGSGKSTVIDAICFALYGSVPRWGRENVIKLALAPSATSGKVALVFESAGRRYGVVRALARGAKGAVTTREARLDELDPSADPAGGIEELLAAQVRTIAAGEQVTAAIEHITGLEYRFFTQCVVLPQGRFAEFLQAKPSERQDLLIQLLDAKGFEAINRRAGEEEKAAKAHADAAERQLAKLTEADEAAESEAAQRLDARNAFGDEVRSALDDLRRDGDEIRDREAEAAEGERAAAALTALAMPPDVPTLADDLAAATTEAERLAGEAAKAGERESAARERLAELGDKTVLDLAVRAHRDHARLTGEIEDVRAEAQDARQAAADAEADAGVARTNLQQAQDERQRVRDAHAAADLAQRLAVGEPCPVCLTEVARLPEHHAPAALGAADRDIKARTADLETAQQRHREHENRLGRLEEKLDGLERQLDAQAEHIRARPDAEDVQRRLEDVRSAEQQAESARKDALTAKSGLTKAEDLCARLNDEAGRGLARLDAARDTVVALGAPPLDPTDLHAAWTTLLDWRDREAGTRRQAAEALNGTLNDLRTRRAERRGAVAERLAAHEIAVPASAEPDTVREAVLNARNQAQSTLDTIRRDRRMAAGLAEDVRRHREEAAVAHELTIRLRANNFENWLCGEALEMLVTGASETLRELSDGQFELVLDARNAIEVIDYAEAGLRRSVRTLSGGETFQASLALALALSDQVARFGGGAARSLDSIFLDEGFGTLDPATLDTVATTLERLTSGGDRMVGLVTHVPALAERIPVRFDVTRDSTGSHLEKKAT